MENEGKNEAANLQSVQVESFWRSLNVSRWLALLFFTAIITVSAWLCDDAYHGFSISRNLVLGNGLVYNIGERVNATTAPLVVLFQALLFAIIRNMFWSGILSGLICSVATAYILLFHFCDSKKMVCFTTALLICSKAFISFTTAGLENPMLFMFFALFFVLLDQIEKKRNGICRSTDFLLMALLVSGIMLTRMDNVLFLIPICLYCFFLKRDKSEKIGKHILFGFLGVLPILFWLAFSTVYYGFPFPNTAYVKLGTGISLGSYIKHGIVYSVQSLFHSPITILLPAFFMIFALFVRKNIILPIFSGVFLYFAYVLYIGGDFMVGRHFTVAYFIAVCGTVMFLKNRSSVDSKIAVVPVYFSIFFMAITLSGEMIPRCVKEKLDFVCMDRCLNQTAAQDEREFWMPLGRIFSPWYGKECRPSDQITPGESDCYQNCCGNVHYFYYGASCASDCYGLGDAFVARCPVYRDLKGWRVGHLKRIVPAEYNHYLQTGENTIQDPELHQLLDDINLVTRGAIWSRERFQAIWRLNCWKPKYEEKDGDAFIDLPHSVCKSQQVGRSISCFRILKMTGFDSYDHYDEGKWMNAKEAEVAFLFEKGVLHSDVKMIVDGWFFTYSGMQPQGVEVFCGEQKLGSFSQNGNESSLKLNFAIPLAQIKDGYVSLRFVLKYLPEKSPRDVGLNACDRKLGYFFHDFQVVPPEEE